MRDLEQSLWGLKSGEVIFFKLWRNCLLFLVLVFPPLFRQQGKTVGVVHKVIVHRFTAPIAWF